MKGSLGVQRKISQESRAVKIIQWLGEDNWKAGFLRASWEAEVPLSQLSLPNTRVIPKEEPNSQELVTKTG